MTQQPYSYSQYTPRGRVPPSVPQTAPATTVRRYEPTDHSAMLIAGLGLGIVFFTMIPAGLFTGPWALCRVRAWERGMAEGRFDPGEQYHFTIARIVAWVSLILSLPVLFIAGLLILAIAAG